MVAVIGANSRIIIRMGMEHTRGLMDTDTLGNTVMKINTVMEYTDGLMEQYITESTKRAREMAKDITGGPLEKNIGDSGKMARNGEKQLNKRREYSTKKHMKTTSASAGAKYSENL